MYACYSNFSIRTAIYEPFEQSVQRNLSCTVSSFSGDLIRKQFCYQQPKIIGFRVKLMVQIKRSANFWILMCSSWITSEISCEKSKNNSFFYDYHIDVNWYSNVSSPHWQKRVIGLTKFEYEHSIWKNKLLFKLQNSNVRRYFQGVNYLWIG